MPVRIYSLAKDLKIDSKELVDICTMAGITGKGSALASLEDDEVVKVKSFIEGMSKKPASPPPPSSSTSGRRIDAPLRPNQDPVLPSGRKPVVIPPRREGPARPDSAPVQPLAKLGSDSSAPQPEPPSVGVEEEADVAVALADEPIESSEGNQVESRVSTGPSKSIASRTPAEAKEGAASRANAPKPTPITKQPDSRQSESRQGDSKQPDVKQPSSRQPDPKQPDSKTSEPAPQRPDSSGLRGGRPQIKILGSGVGARKSGGDPKKTDLPKKSDGPDRGREPAIRMGSLPDARQPTPPPKPQEKTQQPVIKLTPGVLTGGGKTVAKTAETLRDITDRHAKEEGNKGRGRIAPGGLMEAVNDFISGGRGKDDRSKRGGPGKSKTPQAGDALAGMAGVRPDRQKRRRGHGESEEEEGRTIRPGKHLVHVKSRSNTGSTVARKGKVTIQLPCDVRTFSEAAGVGTSKVLAGLLKLGVATNINGMIANEVVELLAIEMGLDLEIRQPESIEDKLEKRFAEYQSEEKATAARPPIVTVLGHVDHGKTSLLDRIIGINVVSGEAGGITQHIRAYQIPTSSGRKVAFVDTPGHEAFTEMRARGANVTDVAVIVVAANDGVMPQTEEAISHAKAANVPIVVAMNKVDLQGIDQQRVLQQLAANGLLPSEWGGDTEVVRTSALTGQGIEDLLETLLLTADLHEFKSNEECPASGTCLEAEQEPGRGVIAKVMVQNGTLREGDIVVCGAAHGRVKAMFDTLSTRKKVKEAGPSTPVNVTGLDIPPAAGDRFYVLEDIAEARDLASARASESRSQSLTGGGTKKVSLEEFQKRLSEGRLGEDEDKVVLNLIIRADVRGSIEAISKELTKFDHPEVEINVLQASVGGITVGDVTLASASDAVIVGFNVIPDEAARDLAERRQVEIRRYDIIYKLTDDIKAMLEGRLKPEERVIEAGRALVKQVFSLSRYGTVAGCQILQGTVERGCRMRVNREGRTIGDYAIESLRREKDDVKEVARGMECGIKLANFNDVKQGDLLEAYKIEEFARSL